MKSKTIAITILTAAVMLLVAACGNLPTASPEATATQPAVASDSGIVAEGKLVPGRSAKLGFSQPGTVAEVLVKAGDQVSEDQLFARLVGSESAQAALKVARIQYEITLDNALAQRKASSRTANWKKNQPEEFNLPLWYYDQSEQISSAQTEVDADKAALLSAQAKLVSVQGRVSSADFVKAETEIGSAQASYDVANDLNNRVQDGKNIDDMTRRQLFLLMRDNGNIARGRDPKWVLASNISKDLRDAAQEIYDDTKANLKDAQTAYDDALTTQGAKDVLKARADVSIAQERYYTALDRLRSLQTGEDLPAVTAAQASMDQAQTAITNYELRAPFAGTVLSIDAVVGELAVAGTPLFFLGDTTHWQVETKNLTEVDVAKVRLGAPAVIKLDAFPKESFSGKVVIINPVGQEYQGDMTYKVTIAIDKPDPRFLWNLTATATIDAMK
jgi:HlyD family secretion protein